MTTNEPCIVGVDVGGTFTDIVVAGASGRRHLHKVLTTPADPLDAVCAGIASALTDGGFNPGSVRRVAHGTTLATNAILEGSRTRTAFITTAGFGDLLRLGRQARVEEDRFDLLFQPRPPLVPAELTFEVDERVTAGGVVVQGLDSTVALAVARRVASTKPDAVAVCLMHSYANPKHEHVLAEALRDEMPDVFVAISSDIWPEPREYDRSVTTVLAASLGPLMAAYLESFTSRLEELGVRAAVDIMESSGGVMRAPRAARNPLATVESGGAAGLTAAGHFGSRAGAAKVLAFDMGGTTAKLGVVVDGRPQVTNRFEIGGTGSFATSRAGSGLPVKLPIVDLAEVGAGGGSIAWIDDTGTLRVGPVSAGADPGPVCYGRGGDRPTVTDANLVLGYLDAERFSDDLRVDRDAAAVAVGELGSRIGLDLFETALAIHEIANEAMAVAVRVVTLQRGIDPRDFTLVVSGGAGPLHAVGLADRFAIGEVVIPAGAGVASAIGLSVASPVVNAMRSVAPTRLIEIADALVAQFSALEDGALAELGEDGEDRDASRVTLRREVDGRFPGQMHAITVDVTSAPLDHEFAPHVERLFRSEYAVRYGVERPDAPVEIVALRLQATGRSEQFSSSGTHVESTFADSRERAVVFPGVGQVSVPVRDWSALDPGDRLPGPVLVSAPQTTAVVPPHWELTVDDDGSLRLRSSSARRT